VPTEEQLRTGLRHYIVSSYLSGDERGFDDRTDLQAIGVLDSHSTLALVAFVEDTFKVQLDPTDINTETFRTVNSVAQLVLAKLSNAGG
jgi:acyl carrier protein